MNRNMFNAFKEALLSRCREESETSGHPLLSDEETFEWCFDMVAEPFISEEKKSGGLTENGTKILTFMKEKQNDFSNRFKAKDIAEGLFMSSRSVSGAMRKLVTDGYVTKEAGNPIVYSLVETEA